MGLSLSHSTVLSEILQSPLLSIMSEGSYNRTPLGQDASATYDGANTYIVSPKRLRVRHVKLTFGGNGFQSKAGGIDRVA